jgi:hypothetical protein
MAKRDDVAGSRPILGPADFAKEISKAIKTMVADGFRLPLRVVAVPVNGVLLAATYEDDEDGELRCIIDVTPGDEVPFIEPVNVLITDADGEAKRIVLKRR